MPAEIIQQDPLLLRGSQLNWGVSASSRIWSHKSQQQTYKEWHICLPCSALQLVGEKAELPTLNWGFLGGVPLFCTQCIVLLQFSPIFVWQHCTASVLPSWLRETWSPYIISVSIGQIFWLGKSLGAAISVEGPSYIRSWKVVKALAVLSVWEWKTPSFNLVWGYWCACICQSLKGPPTKSRGGEGHILCGMRIAGFTPPCWELRHQYFGRSCRGLSYLMTQSRYISSSRRLQTLQNLQVQVSLLTDTKCKKQKFQGHSS